MQKLEELRRELVSAPNDQIPATSTSPLPRISANDSSDSCNSKSSHSHGSLGPKYEEFEDGEEEEDDFGSTLGKEGEAYASKFFLSSSMFDKVEEDVLVLHESHAQPIVQEEAEMAAMATTFLGNDSPCLLSATTANMADSLHHAPSNLLSKENDISNVVDGEVVSAKGKEKVGVVPLQQIGQVNVVDGEVVSAAALGKGLGNMAAKNGLKNGVRDGQATNGQ